MREITLKRGNRPTSVPRSQITKAVKEVFAKLKAGEVIENPAPGVVVVVSNRMPAKTKKK